MSKTSLSVRWHGSFDGSGIIRAPGFTSQVTLPKDFQGLGEGANPEDLLLSAAASCYLITLGIVLGKAGVAYKDLNVSAEMTTQVAPVPEIQEIRLFASLATDLPPAQLQTLSERAEKFCVIGRALNPAIRKHVSLRAVPLSDSPAYRAEA
jgi:peroxiredoxin-like protein